MIPAVERLAGCALATTIRFTTLCTVALASVVIAWPSICLAGFNNAAPMHDARAGHTATLLPSGKVLVAGGFSELMAGGITTFISLASAELYDPASDTWNAAGSMATAHTAHTATLLPSGQVLVAGGSESGAPSAELYDPASNTWSAAGSMATARAGHTATLLPSGQVLVAGGSESGTLASAELYDPASNTWSAAGSMMAGSRVYLTATLLHSGQVLVVSASDSGSSLAGAELYDPGSNTWIAAAPMAGPAGLFHGYTATLLLSGHVLVAGGEGLSGSFNIAPPRFAIAELYDPGSNTWSSAGSMARARADHTATLLASGQVLVAGGSGGGSAVQASAELYDPASNTWSTTDSMATARNLHTATLLRSGKTLVAGGLDSSDIGGPQVPNVFASAELYDPQTQTAVEYYYAGWNYYFVTSFPDEIAALDAGAFGGLWQRTGETLNVWSVQTGLASPTCRFFSTAFAPKSSHFYTPFPIECAAVKNNPSWLFESIAFYIQIPTGYGTGNGFCPQGTDALYRLYNNGVGGAPNHRYTTNPGILDMMLAQGWAFEGEANTKVFACVPH